jgi:hypothetical protein
MDDIFNGVLLPEHCISLIYVWKLTNTQIIIHSFYELCMEDPTWFGACVPHH